MELRPPMIITADSFETQDDGSLNLIGIRHIFEADQFPFNRPVALYCFLGTMREKEIKMSLFMENHQKDNSEENREVELMNSVVQTSALSIPALVPNVTFEEAGFYSFQLKVEHKLYAWCRVEAKLKENKKSS